MNEKGKPESRAITPEQMKRISRMFDEACGTNVVIHARPVSGTPELGIPDGTLVVLDNKTTGKIQVDLLPHTEQSTEPSI